jgi:hypothetical protein
MTFDELKKIPLPDELKKELHSVKYVLDNSNYPALVEMVLNQMGFDNSEDYYNIQNCMNNGASGGYHGFIYHSECEDFVREAGNVLENYIVEFCEETGLMGEEYMDEAISILYEQNYLENANDDIDIHDYEDLINPRLAGMCYGILKWSPFFKNDKFDREDFSSLYWYFDNENMIPSGSVASFLAWFALEGVCREFEKND